MRVLDKDAIGKVTHYYDKIGVAIVKLSKGLKVGDTIKFVKGDDSFDQVVASMQVEHAAIEEAKKGDEVGIKVDRKVKDGTIVQLA